MKIRPRPLNFRRQERPTKISPLTFKIKQKMFKKENDASCGKWRMVGNEKKIANNVPT
jgi:hypothetical protein